MDVKPIISLKLTQLLNDMVNQFNAMEEGDEKETRRNEIKKIADKLYGAVKIESTHES